MFWFLVFLMMAAAVIVMVFPFLREQEPGTADGHALNVYKDQLHQIAQDAENGLLGQEEAAAATLEIKRRMLSTERNAPEKAKSPMSLSNQTTALIIAGLVSAGSVSLYALKGRPDLPAAPGAYHDADRQNPVTASQDQQNQIASVDVMIAGLKARLKENPRDVEGWRMLGWSYFNTEKYQEAASAYLHAVELQPDSADLKTSYGEALARMSGGLVSDQALESFNKAIELDPTNVRSRFFVGLAKEQNGDAPGAVDVWVALLENNSKEDWAADVRTRIIDLAKSNNIDLTGRLPEMSGLAPSVTPGPSQEDIQSAAQMSPEDRQTMIVSMVEGLAQKLEDNPRDIDGWVRLIKSRLVLGQKDLANEAFNKAMATFSDNPSAQRQIRSEAEVQGFKLKGRD